ncbi:related to AP2 6l [Actinidia rufa]|uniref:Related to AP2 6l n=1 Tax=Actinidia rufa TaxID=165716 RepID=A0A7J0F1U3_9ERIC|nr:related to AP2 6l [Actinidia rufa]
MQDIADLKFPYPTKYLILPALGTSWVVAMENAEERDKDPARERSVLRRPINVRIVAAPRRRLLRHRDREAFEMFDVDMEKRVFWEPEKGKWVTAELAGG